MGELADKLERLWGKRPGKRTLYGILQRWKVQKEELLRRQTISSQQTGGDIDNALSAYEVKILAWLMTEDQARASLKRKRGASQHFRSGEASLNNVPAREGSYQSVVQNIMASSLAREEQFLERMRNLEVLRQEQRLQLESIRQQNRLEVLRETERLIRERDRQ